MSEEYGSSETADQDEAMLDKHVAFLMEHFDSVRIFVTRNERDGCTMVCNRGRGNFYASLGQIKEWVIMQDARARTEIRISDRRETDE